MNTDSHENDSCEVEESLRRVAEGDQEALADLFWRHREALRRMVSWRLDRRLNGRVDPSDVLQEVYIDASQRVRRYLAKRALPFALWLRLLTARRLLELHRQHLGAQMRDAGLEVSLENGHWPQTNLACLAARLTGNLTTPSQAVMRAEREARLAEALELMDPLDREVLVLRHFDELSNNEVAALFGLQKAAASHRYVRALERLREILAGMTDLFQKE
jgi:RNA polymerase sigma-70 factor (ECF subfamily)